MPVKTTRRAELAALCGIAAPLAAAQLSQLAMALTGSFALGRIDSTAFAAGGLCGLIIQTITVVSQGILAGVQPLLASDRGAVAAGIQHEGLGARGFAGAYLWVLLLSVLATLMLYNLGPVLVLFAFEPAVIESAISFIGPAAWSVPAILAFAPLRFHLAVEQRTWLIMLALGLGVPVYGALLALLVFGPPALGVAGAGLALTLTWWMIVTAVALVAWLGRLLPQGLEKLRIADLTAGARAVYGIGWPIALIYAAEMGLLTALLLLMGGFGTVALAAHQVAHSLNAIAFMPALALGQAATVRVAFHLGGGRPDVARHSGNLAIAGATVLMASFGVLILTFSTPLTLLFISAGGTDTHNILELARVLNMVLVAFLVFDGLQAVVSGALRGLKDTRVPMLIGLFSYWVTGLPVAVVAGYGLELGPVGLWLGILAGIGAAGCLLLFRWFGKMRSHISKPLQPVLGAV